MWNMMYGGSQGYMTGSLNMLLGLIGFFWFIVFTILVLVKLDKIAKLLEKK